MIRCVTTTGDPILEAIASLKTDLSHKIDANQIIMKNEEKQMSDLQISVNERLLAVGTRLDVNGVRISKLEELLQNNGGGVGENSTLRKMVESLEVEIGKLKGKGPAGSDGMRELTLVIGGLNATGSKENAESWVYDKLWYAYGPKPVNVYVKSELCGILFVQFCSRADREGVVQIL